MRVIFFKSFLGGLSWETTFTNFSFGSHRKLLKSQSSDTDSALLHAVKGRSSLGGGGGGGEGFSVEGLGFRALGLQGFRAFMGFRTFRVSRLRPASKSFWALAWMMSPEWGS